MSYKTHKAGDRVYLPMIIGSCTIYIVAQVVEKTEGILNNDDHIIQRVTISNIGALDINLDDASVFLFDDLDNMVEEIVLQNDPDRILLIESNEKTKIIYLRDEAKKNGQIKNK